MASDDDLAAAARRARRLAQETYDLRLRAELIAAAEAYESQIAAADLPEETDAHLRE